MLKVFEFHFNPENQTSCFGTFCYSPANRQERKSGLLFLIGEIKDPTKKDILEQIAKELKEGFYQGSENGEDVFQVGLDFANQFLKEELSRTDISFGALCLQSPYTVKLSRTGNIKMLLLRGNEAYDMSFDLTNSSNSFSNFIEGSLQKKDKILLLTQNAFNAFSREKLLEEISDLRNSKETKKYFKEKKSLLKGFSGALVLWFVKKVGWPLFAKKRKALVLPSRFGPAYHMLPASSLEKVLVSLLSLIILLLLGYLIF